MKSTTKRLYTSRKIQITKKEDSVKERARYTRLLFEVLLPVLELHATESMISKDKIMKDVCLVSFFLKVVH